MGLFLTRRVKRGHAVGPQVPERFYNDIDEVLTKLDVFNGHIERQGNHWTIVVDQYEWDTAADSHIIADELSQEMVALDTFLRRNQDYGWPSPTWADTLDTGWGFPVRPPGGTAKRYATWAFLSARMRDTLADTGIWGDTGHPWPDSGEYWHTGGDTITCHGISARITGTADAFGATPAFVVDGGISAGRGLFVLGVTDGPPITYRQCRICDDTYAVNATIGGINVNDSSAYHFGGETGQTHAVNIVLWDTAGDSVVLQIKGGIVI